MYRVEVDSLAKTFSVLRKRILGHEVISKTQAIEDVSFKVDENEFVSIVGPSGCGKTTLLRIIAGLEVPDKGEVRVDAERVTRPSNKLCMVFQDILLLPWKTVHTNVELGLKYRNKENAKLDYSDIITKYLDLVGLRGFENHYPHQLSGGMQQRVGLARALAVEPEVLLMDEPFGSLDAQTRFILQRELASIHAKLKKTVIFVTHDLDEAIFLSDRIILMTRRPGRVKEIMPVDLERPRYIYDFKSTNAFAKLRTKLWTSLEEEILGAK